MSCSLRIVFIFFYLFLSFRFCMRKLQTAKQNIDMLSLSI
ncbi:hypothetical protein HMPREF9554_01776 [Treponema phagedenis F0421]|nr:hypothetical protein HMPREF9554_01776 [Treponema phagedenis F0421]